MNTCYTFVHTVDALLNNVTGNHTLEVTIKKLMKEESRW